MEIITSISSILSFVIAIGTILCVTIPNIRKKIVDAVLKTKKSEDLYEKVEEILSILDKQQKKDELIEAKLELLTKADLCMIRDKITRIYYKNIDNKTIKAYELENLSKLYFIYEKLGGNSYIQTIYKIMTTEWSVIS